MQSPSGGRQIKYYTLLPPVISSYNSGIAALAIAMALVVVVEQL